MQIKNHTNYNFISLKNYRTKGTVWHEVRQSSVLINAVLDKYDLHRYKMSRCQMVFANFLEKLCSIRTYGTICDNIGSTIQEDSTIS